MLFRKPALNGFGPEYDRADELREAFWGTIPDWKQWNQSEATQAFLEWFRFGLFMKPEWRPKASIQASLPGGAGNCIGIRTVVAIFCSRKVLVDPAAGYIK
ncbi:hypothetical protein QQZ08_010257 [Neonectria magnoliae]|uniref:Uncharacterized protein n=1 Tax=Neonectria magnoliae TaxID=2732573 RepID=A0ABR1HIS3_9HYPO